MEQAAYVCPSCGAEYGLHSFSFRCTCGSLLEVAPFDPVFPPSGAWKSGHSIFRYAQAMPPAVSALSGGTEAWRHVSMGEGLTPLVPLESGRSDVLVKVDYAMPTLSFKDRGAAVIVAAAAAAGAKALVQDSSGNAGASVAAYAARAGLACDIYVPSSTSPRKVAQIEAYGARAVLVPGSREDTAAAALAAAEKGASDGSAMYASHVYNPLFYQGTKTYVYEIWESLGGRLPDTLYLPLGNGTLVLGAYHALKDLERLGLITRYPRVVAVQAEGCAPVYEAYRSGAEKVEPVVNHGTAAEGIAIAAPMRGSQVLAALREIGAQVVTAPEMGIEDSERTVAGHGFFIETTSAATFTAFFARQAAGIDEGLVVLPLCGAGLKSAH
jgi:threonine synthase